MGAIVHPPQGGELDLDFWAEAQEEMQDELRGCMDDSTKWFEERLAAAPMEAGKDCIRREQQQAVWHLVK